MINKTTFITMDAHMARNIWRKMKNRVFKNINTSEAVEVIFNTTPVSSTSAAGASFPFAAAIGSGTVFSNFTTSGNAQTMSFPGSINAYGSSPPSSSITLFGGPNNKEIVRLTNEGEVIWANGIEVNEAAEAFSRSLSISAEMKAGITERAKCKIRDTIFDEIIAMAKNKGSLTVDELTLMLEATKIMEKLKGL